MKETENLHNVILAEFGRREKPVDRRLAIPRETQAQILQLYAGGAETRSLAERFGVQENYIRKLASRHGIRKGQLTQTSSLPAEKQKSPLNDKHVAAYKRARRGFDLPQHLEPEYTRLLLSGLSRHAAAERLGIMHSERIAAS